MDWELICWCAVDILAILFVVVILLPWNDKYDPNGDDPYKYCPKEE